MQVIIGIAIRRFWVIFLLLLPTIAMIARGSRTGSISWRIATMAAKSKAAQIGFASSLLTHIRMDNVASNTVGKRIQLSCAGIPEKIIWLGHKASKSPAITRERSENIFFHKKKGGSVVKAETMSVDHRLMDSGSKGRILKRKDRVRGSPTEKYCQYMLPLASQSDSNDNAKLIILRKSEVGRDGNVWTKTRRGRKAARRSKTSQAHS
jgi:hypothetical protein